MKKIYYVKDFIIKKNFIRPKKPGYNPTNNIVLPTLKNDTSKREQPISTKEQVKKSKELAKERLKEKQKEESKKPAKETASVLLDNVDIKKQDKKDKIEDEMNAKSKKPVKKSKKSEALATWIVGGVIGLIVIVFIVVIVTSMPPKTPVGTTPNSTPDVDGIKSVFLSNDYTFVPNYGFLISTKTEDEKSFSYLPQKSIYNIDNNNITLNYAYAMNGVVTLSYSSAFDALIKTTELMKNYEAAFSQNKTSEEIAQMYQQINDARAQVVLIYEGKQYSPASLIGEAFITKTVDTCEYTFTNIPKGTASEYSLFFKESGQTVTFKLDDGKNINVQNQNIAVVSSVYYENNPPVAIVSCGYNNKLYAEALYINNIGNPEVIKDSTTKLRAIDNNQKLLTPQGQQTVSYKVNISDLANGGAAGFYYTSCRSEFLNSTALPVQVSLDVNIEYVSFYQAGDQSANQTEEPETSPDAETSPDTSTSPMTSETPSTSPSTSPSSSPSNTSASASPTAVKEPVVQNQVNTETSPTSSPNS